jgi:hypothetical protein
MKFINYICKKMSIDIDNFALLSCLLYNSIFINTTYMKTHLEMCAEYKLTLKELEKIRPELAASLADVTSSTNDPILDQATYQSGLQTQMIGYLDVIQKALLQVGSGDPISNAGGAKLEAYQPKLTAQQQKAIQDAIKTSATPVIAETVIARDKKRSEKSPPSFASKMMFGQGDFYDAIRRPYTYENEKYQVQYYEGRDRAVGPYAQNPAPSFSEFGSFSDEEYARGTAQGGVRNYNPDYGLPYAFNEKAKSAVIDNNYFMESKALDRGTFGNKLPYNLASDGDGRPFNMEQIRSTPTSQPFTQQEAALNNNTSLTSTLNTSLQALTSTLTNFQTNVANLNNPETVANTPANQGQNTAGAQANTTIGPFSVVINQDQAQADMTAKVNQAMEKLKSEVLQLVNVKVPPTTTPQRIT